MRLSICIPTYNRKQFLRELLNSIKGQITLETAELIEVCISDNASTDGTENLVDEFKDYFRVVYSRNEKNLGPDLNYIKSVEISSGEYCWLMGSDDVIPKSALSRIMKEIEAQSDVDIFLFNRIECDKEMKPLLLRYWFTLQNDYVFDFRTEDKYLYTATATSLGALFSYLSSIVVKKRSWHLVKPDLTFNGTAYMHVYFLFNIIKFGGKLKYIKEALVLNRQGNEVFFKSLPHRLMLDLDGYIKLISKVFSDDPAFQKALFGVLRRECSISRVKNAYMWTTDESWEIIKKRLFEIGYTDWEITDIENLRRLDKIRRFLRKLLGKLIEIEETERFF